MNSARTEKQRPYEVATEKTEGPIARFHEVTLKNDDIAYALINREYGLAISPDGATALARTNFQKPATARTQEYRLRHNRHPFHHSGPLANYILNPSPLARGSCRTDPFFAGRFGACLRFQTKNMQQPIFQFGSEPQNTTNPLSSSHPSSVQERLVTYGSEALDTAEHLGLILGSQKAADTLLKHFGSLAVLARAIIKMAIA
jgi:hypothetical protein